MPVARRELLGFGLSPETTEDLIQEAATVVLRKRPDFESGNDLAPYVRVVVRRLALHWLRDHRRELVGPVPDRPALHAVPDVVEGRMRLAGTFHAFRSLQPGQQALLSDYIAERVGNRAADKAAERRAGVRERKQVQRLRMAMARVADGFAAALGWLRLRFPWLDAVPSQAVAIGLALSALVVGVLAPPTDARPSETRVVSPSGQLAPATLVGHVRDTPAESVPPTSRPPGAAVSRSDPPPAQADAPRAREVARISPLEGGEIGWEKTPNSPEKGWVCAGGVTSEDTCVQKVPFPTVPSLP